MVQLNENDNIHVVSVSKRIELASEQILFIYYHQ